MSRINVANFRHPDGTSDNISLDDSGRVGVANSTPGSLDAFGDDLVIGDGSGHRGTTIYSGTGSQGVIYFADGTTGGDVARGKVFYSHSDNYLAFDTDATERMRIDSSGNLRFNSGYGSVATAYGCRAWINFQGNGGYATRGSGNVSSFTEIGSGNGGVYNVNLTNALPDTNGIILCSKTQSQPHGDVEGVATGSYVSASQLRVVTGDWDGTYVRTPHYSATFVHVAVFR